MLQANTLYKFCIKKLISYSMIATTTLVTKTRFCSKTSRNLMMDSVILLEINIQFKMELTCFLYMKVNLLCNTRRIKSNTCTLCLLQLDGVTIIQTLSILGKNKQRFHLVGIRSFMLVVKQKNSRIICLGQLALTRCRIQSNHHSKNSLRC